MSKIFINTDGGSRGNPGPAAIGVVFFDEDGKIIHKYKECIGVATNNEAEYGAIIKALEILSKSSWLKDNTGNGGEVVCRLDSQLVVEQLCGRYKVKKDHIKVLISKAFELIDKMSIEIKFIHVVREENKEADKLVNLALDEQKDSNIQF